MRNRTVIGWKVLFLAMASSLVLLVLVRAMANDLLWIKEGMIKADNTNIWEIFFSVFGLIYAIIVGLFIVEAHRRIRELSTAVQSELNALGDINDFLRYFKEEGREMVAVPNVRVALSEYVTDVSADMVPKHKDSVLHDANRRKHIAAIIDAIDLLKPQEDNDKFALDAIIQKVGELTSFRAQKTEIARRGFPRPFYGLLQFMTAMTIFGFILQSVESAILHGILVSAITFATTVLYLIVLDLDSPLDGYWNIRDELKKSVAVIKENLIGPP